MQTSESLEALLQQVRACRICAESLPLGPRPVLRASTTARLLVVGQAPGTKVHASGTPWDDQSGKRLRQWLHMDSQLFYDESQVAIIPMGLCYPGKGRSGDLPPRPECARHWHAQLLSHLPRVELTLLIGKYAQDYFLGARAKATLTETVAAWQEYLPDYLPLPHPSPRNQFWLKRHLWFGEEVLPVLEERIKNIFPRT